MGNEQTEPVSEKQNILQELLNNPTLKYGVPRAFLADSANKRMTRMALEGERPYFQDPF